MVDEMRSDEKFFAIGNRDTIGMLDLVPLRFDVVSSQTPSLGCAEFQDSRSGFSGIDFRMAKGLEVHQARVAALQLLGKDLARRARSKCELTGVSGVPLRAYEVPPVSNEPDLGRTLLVSEPCLEGLEHPDRLKGREWQILAETVWSEMPAVQVVAWRMLERLAKKEDWAREVIGEVFLDEEVETWAKSVQL